MNFNRSMLKARANAAFQHNYWNCVLAAILFGLANRGLSFSFTNFSDLLSTGGSVEELLAAATALLILAAVLLAIWLFACALNIFLLSPLQVGGCNFFILNSCNERVGISVVGRAFRRTHYWNVVKTMFLRSLFTGLWSLLLVIPGIIKSYEYRMIPYLLAENPEMPWQEAFRISREMMYGNKWETFVLDLSFYGWFLLSICTCGILSIFFVNPYYYATCAELYLMLREQRRMRSGY